MYLKRLEIYGFKSFASKSVLDFNDEENSSQITAIVGPNGSGKSNVADAIRWVLGEQSSKLLRSKRNEDVIFGGSASRAKGSYAEITMILGDEKPFEVEINNKKHVLNEIEVGRKLYRSGESEYLVNRKKVRLIDLQQLFASLGFGQSSYTVIGQGMVDRLLFFNAAERKVLFDEAAGVKQYEIKREQAIRKLESTDGNLTRLGDILSELEPRVINLRRLVKRAEGRKEFEAELASIQQAYYGSLLFEYGSKIAEFQKEKDELNKKIVQKNEEILAIDREIEQVKDLNKNEDEISKIEAGLNQVTIERDALMQEVAMVTAQINQKEQRVVDAIREKELLNSEKITLTEKIAFLSGKITDNQGSLKQIEQEKSELTKKLETLSGDKAEIEAKIQSVSTEINTSEVENAKTGLKELEAKKAEISGQIFAARNEVSNAENNRRRQESRKNELEAEMIKLDSEIAEIRQSMTAKQKESKNLTNKLNSVEKKAAEVLNWISRAEKELAESFDFKKEEIAEFEKEISAAVTELTDIKKGQGKLELFWSKVESIFTKAKKLTNSLNQEKRALFETKISELREENRVLATDQNRFNLEISKLGNEIEYLKQREASVSQRTGGIIAELKSLVEVKETDFSKQIEALEKNLTVVEAKSAVLSEKIQNASKSLAEKQHKLLSEKNVLQEKEAEIRREVYELEIELNRKKTVAENQERELESAKARLSQIEDKILNTKIDQKEEDSSKGLEKKKELLEAKNSKLSSLRAKLSEVIALQREESSSAFAKEREKHMIEQEVGGLKEKINDIDLEKAKYETRQEDILAELNLAEIKVEQKGNVLTQGEKDIMRAKMENLKRRLETIGSVDPETVTEYEELEKRSSEMAMQVEDLTKAKADLEKVIKELDEKIKKQFSSAFDHIAKEFNRYFEILFNGGKASLSLGEDEEGNYGIEISANPPGKRVSSLNILSGGERTLTSLALLFAILSINPSPFCVLDEVDAALDESNTVRFAEILEKLCQKTQFIVISHNRNTMKAADTLYGVTMDTDHVSKLISVRLAEALETAK